MVGTYCCVPGCFNNTLKNKELSFHVFPKDETLRGVWIRNLSRLDERKFSVWQPKTHHKVCDAHFAGGKKTYMNNVPIVFPVKVERSRKKEQARLLLLGAKITPPGQLSQDGSQFNYPQNVLTFHKRAKQKYGQRQQKDFPKRTKVPFTSSTVPKKGSVVASLSLNHQEGDDEKARFEAAQTLLDIFKVNSSYEGVQMTTVCEALQQINEKLNTEIAGLKDEHRYLKAEYNQISGELKRFKDGESRCCTQFPTYSTIPRLQTKASAECSPDQPSVYPDTPTDWSIKTRVLITSPTPFSWAKSSIKLLPGMGSIHRTAIKADDFYIKQEPDDSPTLKCAFQQSLKYWMYPRLPWLQLFPRIGVDSVSVDDGLQWSPDYKIQNILMKDWLSSCSSLFDLLQSGHCPFFYICTYQFTVLFKAAQKSRRESISALLYPANVEVLEAMRLSEVVFSTYLVENSQENVHVNLSSPHGCGSVHLTPAHLNYIKNIKKTIDSHAQKSFPPIKTEPQEEIPTAESSECYLHQRYQDMQLKFLVVVEGSYTESLITFLMNSSHIVAQEGVQRGLPPTLLCPVAFPGAALQLLQVSNTCGKVQSCHGPLDSYSLEITGPILPHCMDYINHILQCNKYGVTLNVVNVHECTAVFNVHLSN
ncbi:protein downstream neighbor of Son-like isoform X1 [Stegostoma tigrinum]|uniref:protein downstream neighbor of Son-like isoform X1 n=1 Tax=Stegostoma tigrinum TaxID=3053191 RepID=UPI00202B7669|nr:protein downstream neighbor of Son-like isoform X1 [Stegostoma tigrinum]XP_059501418.1 protein downstream neighbor of Son-like isoform X1 [Stegostoma tigrinum]